MSGPFIFFATNRLKEGTLEDERGRVAGPVEFIKESEPRLLALNEYATRTAPKWVLSAGRAAPPDAL